MKQLIIDAISNNCKMARRVVELSTDHLDNLGISVSARPMRPLKNEMIELHLSFASSQDVKGECLVGRRILEISARGDHRQRVAKCIDEIQDYCGV